MGAKDMAALIHPAIAMIVIFPLLGIVVNYAWQTRQRRLKAADGTKGKIPANVGSEHLRLGRWLSNSVVALVLIGVAYPIFSKAIPDQTWTKDPTRFGFVLLLFPLAIASLVILNQARPRLWRGIFASLTGMALILLGSQPEVYRRGEIFDFANQKWFVGEWYVSHYYYGMTAAMLMIFSLAIFPDIYQDRTNRWRNIHIALNCLALLLFVAQALTGSRDLLEIPLSWQEQYIYKCDFTKLVCPS
jgi:cytochrome c biogenesis factor